jgi:hypothetical protein
MSRRVTFARAGLVTLALGMLGATSACDLLEFARNPAVTFQLPEQKFTIRNQEWKAPPPTFSTAIACGKDADCCTVPGSPGTPAPFNCSDYALICDAGTCAMTFTLEVPKLVDLSKDAPTLAAMKGKVLSDIVLQSMQYTVNNQLAVALPPLSIHMAPSTVPAATGNPAAKHLTTVPAIPASTMLSGAAPLNVEGQKAFSAFAKDFKTPFNFIATAVFVMRSGAPIPAQSQIDIAFTGTVTAKF